MTEKINFPPDLIDIQRAIADVLCSLALSDHMGDVRDAEQQLWRLIDVPELTEDDDAYYGYPWAQTKARLKKSGLLPKDYDYDD